jgi:L-arabinose isomerase
MHIERRKPLTANVGVMSVGLNTYWEQFPGLLDEMTRKCEVLKSKLANFQVNVIDFGMVDCSERAYEVLPQMQGANLDILFVDMTTYATSSTFGAIIRDLTCPVILVALQPMEAMDYEKGTTFMQLCNDDICSVPEFTGVAIRMNHPVSDVIIGTLENDDVADEKIHQWCKIPSRRNNGYEGILLQPTQDLPHSHHGSTSYPDIHQVAPHDCHARSRKHMDTVHKVRVLFYNRFDQGCNLDRHRQE